jgi:hypothetical protein
MGQARRADHQRGRVMQNTSMVALTRRYRRQSQILQHQVELLQHEQARSVIHLAPSPICGTGLPVIMKLMKKAGTR